VHLFDRKPSEEPGNNTLAVQLKKLYRGVSTLETRILNDDIDGGGPEEGRIMLKGQGKGDGQRCREANMEEIDRGP
jgi:protein SMG6